VFIESFPKYLTNTKQKLLFNTGLYPLPDMRPCNILNGFVGYGFAPMLTHPSRSANTEQNRLMEEKQIIKFRCTECGQLLRAEPELAGVEIECPTCSTALTTPDSVSEVSFANDYTGLTDEQLEKRLAEISDLMEKEKIMGELTKRFNIYYIDILDRESASGKTGRFMEKLGGQLHGWYLAIRLFFENLIKSF